MPDLSPSTYGLAAQFEHGVAGGFEYRRRGGFRALAYGCAVSRNHEGALGAQCRALDPVDRTPGIAHLDPFVDHDNHLDGGARCDDVESFARIRGRLIKNGGLAH